MIHYYIGSITDVAGGQSKFWSGQYVVATGLAVHKCHGHSLTKDIVDAMHESLMPLLYCSADWPQLYRPPNRVLLVTCNS